MSWNAGFSSSYANGQPNTHYNNQLQPHYANAYYYQQQVETSQHTQIIVPSPGLRHQPMASLVPPHMRNRNGPVRCGHEGCLFAGTHKEVEVHKMDRHLIFPPGWQEKGKGKRKRDDNNDYVDEEAQFRASGSVSILGTDVKLDSPEAMAAWLEERKKRWPSAKRIAEKAQNRREALERGQILAEPSRIHGSGPDGNRGQLTQSQRGRGRGRGKPANHIQAGVSGVNREYQPINTHGQVRYARGRGGRGSRVAGTRGRGNGQVRQSVTESLPVDPKESNRETNTISGDSSTSDESTSESESDSDSDDSGSDMDPLQDAVSSKTELQIVSGEVQSPEIQEPAPIEPHEQLASTQSNKLPPRRSAPQPPKPVYNPFNQRPNLLRNLLMPDIQATVSNLSQAIKFLVANDFLDNVEIKPGDAENVPIQPMDIGAQQ